MIKAFPEMIGKQDHVTKKATFSHTLTGNPLLIRWLADPFQHARSPLINEGCGHSFP